MVEDRELRQRISGHPRQGMCHVAHVYTRIFQTNNLGTFKARYVPHTILDSLCLSLFSMYQTRLSHTINLARAKALPYVTLSDN